MTKQHDESSEREKVTSLDLQRLIIDETLKVIERERKNIIKRAHERLKAGDRGEAKV